MRTLVPCPHTGCGEMGSTKAITLYHSCVAHIMCMIYWYKYRYSPLMCPDVSLPRTAQTLFSSRWQTVQELHHHCNGLVHWTTSQANKYVEHCSQPHVISTIRQNVFRHVPCALSLHFDLGYCAHTGSFLLSLNLASWDSASCFWSSKENHEAQLHCWLHVKLQISAVLL